MNANASRLTRQKSGDRRTSWNNRYKWSRGRKLGVGTSRFDTLLHFTTYSFEIGTLKFLSRRTETMSNSQPNATPMTQTFSQVPSLNTVNVHRESEASEQPVESSLITKWLGRPLNQYIVERWIGGGGMGQVYLARHRWLDVPFAIKILNPTLDEDTEAIDRFKRESQLAAKLNHPNIVRATDGGTIENSFYLVTEFLDGIDLADLISRNGPLPADFACWVVSELAQGLKHAHQKGLIHRDIKPSNIMLLRDGSVKLLDFGLARYANAGTQMTATGQFMGTIDYVSPEQATDTRAIDHRADIYSLGCTLYFLLTGKVPFDGIAYDTIVSKILAHAEEEPQPIDTLCDGVPKGVQKIVNQMMSKHPDDRYQSADEVVQSLAPFAANHPAFCDQLDGLGSSVVSTAQDKTDWVEEVSEKILHVAWCVLRTLLSTFGILERVEVSSRSRLGGKKQYRWQVSPRGIVVFIAIVVAVYFVFSNIRMIGSAP